MKCIYSLLLFSFYYNLWSAEADKSLVQRPLAYWVQEEDVPNVRFSLPKATQEEKDRALCLACRARANDDLLKKKELIHALIQGGASKSAEHNGQTPLQIVNFHQVWYEDKGVLTELQHLVTEYEE